LELELEPGFEVGSSSETGTEPEPEPEPELEFLKVNFF
jgi:hypothetical protein